MAMCEGHTLHGFCTQVASKLHFYDRCLHIYSSVNTLAIAAKISSRVFGQQYPKHGASRVNAYSRVEVSKSEVVS